jgi:hypothetical protein
MPDPVDLHVVGSGPQEGRVVAHESEGEVAPLAEEGSHETRLVVVIEVLGVGFAADGAPVALPRTEILDRFAWNAVLAQPVRLVAGATMARFALAPEAGGRRRAAHVVLMRDRLLTSRTPSEAIRHPGEIPYVAPLSSSLAAIRLPAPRAIARLAVDGQPVRLDAVAAELG